MKYTFPWLARRVCLFVVIGSAACSSALSGEGGGEAGTDGSTSDDSGSTGPDASAEAAGDAGSGDVVSSESGSGDSANETGTDAGTGDAGLDAAKDVASDVASDVRPMEASFDVGTPDVVVLCPFKQPASGSRCYENGLDCPYGKFSACLCEASDAGLHWQCVAF